MYARYTEDAKIITYFPNLKEKEFVKTDKNHFLVIKR